MPLQTITALGHCAGCKKALCQRYWWLRSTSASGTGGSAAHLCQQRVLVAPQHLCQQRYWWLRCTSASSGYWWPPQHLCQQRYLVAPPAPLPAAVLVAPQHVCQRYWWLRSTSARRVLVVSACTFASSGTWLRCTSGPAVLVVSRDV